MAQSVRLGYRPEIDGLRALAVVAVILQHTRSEWLPSGYLGVDIFFVISGFVITASLLARGREDASAFFLGFYSRRFKRILPALVVFVLIAGAVIAFFSPGGPSLRTGAAALFGLGNLYLFREATDYFGQASELNMFTHTWSLGVEEQFYFVYPLLVWLAGIPRGVGPSSSRLFMFILVGSVASLLLWLVLSRSHPMAAYFLMPARLWELGAGCLACLAMGRWQAWPDARFQGVGLGVAGAMVAVLFLPESANVLATVLMIALTTLFLLTVRSGSLAYALFTQPQVVFIGLISYSLYLWHWGVLCLSRWTIGMDLWMVPFQYGLILLLAISSYRWIETPLRRAIWSPRVGTTVAIGLGASAASAVVLLFTTSVLRRLSPVKPNPELAYESHQVGWQTCAAPMSTASDAKKGFCLELKQPPHPVRVVLLGDSHAGQLGSGLRSILPALPTSIRSVYQAACYPKLDSDCSMIRNGLAWAKATPSVAVVLLSGYHNLVINNNRFHWDGLDIAKQVPGALVSLEKSLGGSIAALTDAGKEVVMIVDSHELLHLPEENIIPLTGLLRRPGSLDVSRELVWKRNQAYYAMLERLAQRNPRFHLVYEADLFCDATTCHSDLGGRPLFQTRDHLTPYGSGLVAAKLKPLLLKLLQPSNGSAVDR